jgi:hypothetical protein
LAATPTSFQFLTKLNADGIYQAKGTSISASNNNAFTGSDFMNIIHGQTINSVTGAYINDLSGDITISNINKTLRYIVDSNVFGNRTPVQGTDYGVGNGYLPGDMFLIPTGLTVTLQLAIGTENYMPINNIGPSLVSSYNSSTYNYVNGMYASSTLATMTNIKQVVSAPLLIVLDNLSL